MSDEDLMKLMLKVDPRTARIPPGVRAIANAVEAAERERWTKRVREAFNEGFSSPVTYNDTLQNSVDEAWEKEKAWLLRA